MGGRRLTRQVGAATLCRVHSGLSHRRDWEDLARLDPLWAIASRPGLRHGGWSDDEFMASGRRKVARIMRTLGGLEQPVAGGRALDFGCGVGRVTIPLGDHFEEVVGADIAPGMVEQARARAAAAGSEGVRFVLDEHEDLSGLGAEPFDLVFTSLVLQHLPSRAHVEHRAQALARRVAPGGALIAQMPSRLAPWSRIQPTRHAYGALRRVGVPPELLYHRLRLQPMRLVAFPRPAFKQLLEAEGLRVTTVRQRRNGARLSCIYVAIRPAA